MDLLTYISSYSNCAVNNVPIDVLHQWKELYPELEIPEPHRHQNIRFLRGKFISYMCSPYMEGEHFIGGSVQCVIEHCELGLPVNGGDNIDDTFMELI